MALPRIFLADDNIAEGELMRQAIAEAELNLDLLQVPDGVDAWAALRLAADAREFPFALIVIDLHLVGMDGLTLIDKLNRLPALTGIPKIIFTASVNPRHRDQAMQHNAHGFVLKPFRYADMITVVKDFARLIHDRDPGHKRPRSPWTADTLPPGTV